MNCSTRKTNKWQEELINLITEPRELIELLELNPNLIEQAEKVAKTFPLKVPRGFVKRMKKGDLTDPLLNQVLPLNAELQSVEGYNNDPLKEKNFNPISGLLHKYHGRVLLTLTGACGINCRYCFRRHFDYDKNNPGTEGWNDALYYIARDSTIHEVILSGGDPLVLNDSSLKLFTEKLAAIPHLKRLRIHSRMPIVMPERITADFLNAITHNHFKTTMVVHCNHPQEMNDEVKDAVQLLKRVGITVLNQTVLLKEINDQADILINLSETLFDAGILPYYLHVLDRVAGAAHFDIPRQVAKNLHDEITNRLSGYLVPKLVCEQPDAPAKIAVNT